MSWVVGIGERGEGKKEVGERGIKKEVGWWRRKEGSRREGNKEGGRRAEKKSGKVEREEGKKEVGERRKEGSWTQEKERRM